MAFTRLETTEKRVCECCENVIDRGTICYANLNEYGEYWCSGCYVDGAQRSEEQFNRFVESKRHPSWEGWDWEDRYQRTCQLNASERTSLLHDAALAISKQEGISYAEAACIASEVENVYDQHRAGATRKLEE